MKTNIGIKQEYLDKVAEYLATILADEFIRLHKNKKCTLECRRNRLSYKTSFF